MKFVAAYVLLALGGKENPSADDIKALLSGAGVEVDEEKLTKFASSVEGKNIDELLKDGRAKMKALAGAGGSGGGSGGAAAGGAAAAEEEKVEEEEEEVDVGGGGLFGGDDGGDGY